MPNCISCQAWLKEGETTCCRCEADNKRWLELCNSQQFYLFFGSLPWGIATLLLLIYLPTLFPVVLVTPRDAVFAVALDATTSPEIGMSLGAILSWVFALLIWSLRDELRLYSWTRQLPASGFSPSLPLLAAIAFTLALVLGLAVVAVIKANAGEGASAVALPAWQQLILTISMALALTNVTVSAALMAAYDYIRYINGLAPPPIFSNENLFMKVITRDARYLILWANRREENVIWQIARWFADEADRELLGPGGNGNLPVCSDPPSEPKPDDELIGDTHIELVEFARLPDGGATAILQHVWLPMVEDDLERLLQQGLWGVQVNRWARIQNLRCIATRRRAAVGRYRLQSPRSSVFLPIPDY